MLFGYLLLVLLPIAAIGYIVWNHKRRTAERDAASAERLHELFGAAAYTQPRATAATADTAETADTAAKAERVVAPAPAPVRVDPPPRVEPEQPTPQAPIYSLRPRMLTPPQTLLYLLLRTGLPDHVIFARVSLASVLDVGPALVGAAREEHTRRIASTLIDFVVADKSMQPVAIVQLASAPINESDRSSLRALVTAAGVRYIELDARALPKKEAIRAVVLEGVGEPITAPNFA